MGIQSDKAPPTQKATEPIATNENASEASESKNVMSFLRSVGSFAKRTFTNPKVQIYGAAGIAAASCACAVLLREPNISGTIAGIGTGVEGLPQAIQSFRTRSTKDISLLFLTLNESTVAGFTAYGFMLHSMPLIISDAFCFAFNTVPLTIKVGEVISSIKERNAAKKNAETITKDDDCKTNVFEACKKFMRGAKDKLSNPVVNLSVAAAPIAIAGGTMASSLATGNPNIVGSYTALVCGSICAPQAWQSFKTRSVKDLSLESMLVCLAAEFNWITYGIMIKAPAVIAGDGGVALFGAVPLVIKIAEVMGKKNTEKADTES
jgi:MtN3 and saliva related transmembrane protein